MSLRDQTLEYIARNRVSFGIGVKVGGRAWQGTGALTPGGDLLVTYVGGFSGTATYTLYSDGVLRGSWRSYTSPTSGTEVLQRTF